MIETYHKHFVCIVTTNMILVYLHRYKIDRKLVVNKSESKCESNSGHKNWRFLESESLTFPRYFYTSRVRLRLDHSNDISDESDMTRTRTSGPL